MKIFIKHLKHAGKKDSEIKSNESNANEVKRGEQKFKTRPIDEGKTISVLCKAVELV